MTISILGCGWLGLPLGTFLHKKSHTILGSTTREEKLPNLETAGISPFLINLNPQYEGDLSFLQSDLIIINLPPRNREGNPNFHQDQLISIKNELLKSPIRKLIFVSSTAVYPNVNGEVTEQDASETSISRGGVSLVKMENIFRETPEFQTTIIRFGGLYGPERHPGRFLAGKKDLSGANNPVNMIHLDDCIGVIDAVIDKEAWGEVFNACSPNHPSRKEFYQKAAKDMGLEPPSFNEQNEQNAPFKKVSSGKLVDLLGYRFLH